MELAKTIIASIVTSVNPRRGGKERFVFDLCKEIMARGHNVTVLLCDDQFSEKLDCRVERIGNWNIPGFPPIPSPWAIIRNLHQRFDLVHLHYSSFLGEIVAIACKLRGLPLITTFHDEMKRGSHKFLYDRILLTIISKLSSRVICLSESMKITLKGRGLSKKKISVISNGFHVKALQGHVKELRKIKARKDSILFVGRLEERKGPHYLLEALVHLRKKGIFPKLTVIGDGPYKHKLISYTKENNLVDQVDFTGYVTSQKLLKCYAQARCVIIPSLFEGIPTVAIEAMTFGIPIVASAIPGMEMIASKEIGLTVPPKDSRILADAIHKCLELPEKERSLIASKEKNLALVFDWSVVATNIISLYNELLDSQLHL